MNDQNHEAAEAVKEELKRRGYNPEGGVQSENNPVTGQRIEITSPERYPNSDDSDHYEPMEDDGAYADDTDND